MKVKLDWIVLNLKPVHFIMVTLGSCLHLFHIIDGSIVSVSMLDKDNID
jgi:hypothetical protein